MGLVEVLLISIGLSLDVFVASACLGAGFSKVRKKNLAGLSLLFGTMQLLALVIGNIVTLFPFSGAARSERIADRWEIFSVLIFVGLGIYMISKAARREEVPEKRRDVINWSATAALAALTSVDAFFAGIGFGILNTQTVLAVLSVFIVTVLEAVLGVYAGYWLGLKHNRKAYWIGGALLLISGVDVAIHFCM